MQPCACRKLRDLVIISEMRATQPVQYSVQRQRTLWDADDRVEEEQRRFYVTLRHFSGQFMGRHVGLTGVLEKFTDRRGEKRTYRLPVGTSPGEHLSVYVYNPAVCTNGELHFEISTSDTHCRAATERVRVHPDSCPAVCRFACPSMQTAHVTRLLTRDDNYLIELHVCWEGIG